MRAQHDFGSKLLVGLLTLGFGCGGTLDTGKAKKPVNNKPAEDGTCPSGQNRCGSGVFAVCVDLQDDPNHCGACDRQCSPGIACATGVCQQTVCTDTSIPFSGQPATSISAFPSVGTPYTWANQLLADVNGDGRLDLIEWHGNREFGTAVAQPGGGFAPPDIYQASAVISRIFATDVNGDGLADLYVVSSTFESSAIAPHRVELWLGQSDGHLRRFDAAGMSVDGLALSGSQIGMGDLSGDGWPDLVMDAPEVNYDGPPKINVYLSDSTGALHLTQTLPAWSSNTFIRDWNRDGSPDLVLLAGDLELVYNRGDGTFEEPVECALSVGGASMGEQDLLVEDFNRDGWMDLAAGDFFRSRVGIMLGLGGCGFAPISAYDLPGSSVGFLRAADLNGDGLLDIVSASAVHAPDPDYPNGLVDMTTDNLLAVLIGKPDGSFQLQDHVISLGPKQISDVTIGEITGDGRPDIVVSSVDGQTGRISTWENTCQ